MSKTAEKIPTADEIAEMADKGEDISRFFTGDGKMKPPLNKPGMQCVSVDFTPEMLHGLDNIARELNISREAVIKMYIRQAIDQYYTAKKVMAS
ncbi:MAG: ribbon-helix-helix domain-containing protein [Desulfococcaceae bacterium]